MKSSERGYTLVELLIAITIIVMVAGTAGAAIFQVLKNTERNNDHIAATRQVQNASYWISRDTQIAVSVTAAGNLTLPDFLSLSWTNWDDDGNSIYHSANYTFEGLTDGLGKLKRNYGSSAGASEETLVAQYIYYDPDDVDATSNTSYENPVLTVTLTALIEGTMETREYKITRRLGL